MDKFGVLNYLAGCRVRVRTCTQPKKRHSIYLQLMIAFTTLARMRRARGGVSMHRAGNPNPSLAQCYLPPSLSPRLAPNSDCRWDLPAAGHGSLPACSQASLTNSARGMCMRGAFAHADNAKQALAPFAWRDHKTLQARGPRKGRRRLRAESEARLGVPATVCNPAQGGEPRPQAGAGCPT